MKVQFDFFSITNLSFDPFHVTKKRVLEAIYKELSELKSQLNDYPFIKGRLIIQSKIDLLDEHLSLIQQTEWKKYVSDLAVLAEIRKKKECERLQVASALLIDSGVTSISIGSLRYIRMNTGLSFETIKIVLSDCGVTVSFDSDKTNIFPDIFEDIDRDINLLKTIKNYGKSDISHVVDLYSFVAFLLDDLSHAETYRMLSVDELDTIYRIMAQKYSMRNDDFGKLCSSISCSAEYYVFNSKENRMLYDYYLIYQNDSLQELFDSLKLIPSGLLLQSDFAEGVINRIREYISDYDLALRIYNKEANLKYFSYDPSNNCIVNKETKKKERHSKIYGIDLGTTYSVIATLDDNGMPEVIENLSEGSQLLASAVYFQDGAYPIVGEVAKAQKYHEPDKVVEFVKRFIGKPDAPTWEYNGIKYDPISISALILKRLKVYADEQGHNVENVVITCPAYFGHAEKAATKQAGIIAGLNVLNIVNEPTAAAIYYCARELSENRKIMVYDLGGGTFDVTVFDFAVNEDGKADIDVIKVDGDDRLGGIDWDERMFDYMCQKYSEENGTEVDEMDHELKATIRAMVEQAKKDLSSLDRKSFTIKYDGDRTRIELTREEFEERTKDLVDKTMNFVHRLLKDVKLTPDDVDVVLLVGGSTFMPMIRRAVEEVFPNKVRIEQPNLAVAKGAALSAANVWNERVDKLKDMIADVGNVIFGGEIDTFID